MRAVKERHVSFKSPLRVQDRDKELLEGTEDNFASLMTDEGSNEMALFVVHYLDCFPLQCCPMWKSLGDCL